MPTYDYRCEACQHEWELFQKMSDDPVKKCPECKKKKATRLFGTGAAVVFKGSGFYETDYRSESYKKGEKKAKESAKETSKEGSKGDSASASKSKSSQSSSGSKSKDGQSKGKSGSDS